MGLLLPEYRCICGQLLFRGVLNDSFLEIKCKRCKKINIIRSTAENSDGEAYLLMYDVHGNIVDTYFTGQTILGYDKSELVGQNVNKIPLHIDEGYVSNLWNRVRTTRFDPFSIETLQRHKKGELVYIQEKIHIKKIGEEYYTIVAHEVIKNPVSGSNTGSLAEINIDGVFTCVSLELAQELRLVPEDMLGRSLFDFCSEEYTRILKLRLPILLNDRKSFSIPGMKLIKRNSEHVHFDLSFVTTYNNNNVLRGFTVFHAPQLCVDKTFLS